MTNRLNEAEGAPFPWWLILIEGIFAVIIGLALLVAPEMAITTIVSVMGIYWLLGGILAIVSIFTDQASWGWKLLIGLVGILAGIGIIQHPVWATLITTAALLLFMAILGIIFGVVSLYLAFKGRSLGLGILGLLSIAFGLILLGEPLRVVTALTVLLGIAGIVGGLLAIVAAFRAR